MWSQALSFSTLFVVALKTNLDAFGYKQLTPVTPSLSPAETPLLLLHAFRCPCCCHLNQGLIMPFKTHPESVLNTLFLSHCRDRSHAQRLLFLVSPNTHVG